MLHICLLGEFRVTQNNVLIYKINSPRLYSLLAYLLIHRDTPHHRRNLSFMLWPDSSEAQARTNLRKLLYQLRQVLPDTDTYLNFQGQMVQWQHGAGFTLDVEEFRVSVQAAAKDTGAEQRYLERAAALYRGDLLPGCYDEWIEPERESLRVQFAVVLERLIVLNETKRAYIEALSDARRLLQLDELNENAYRHLMRLHALNGDRAAALRVYHSCVTTFLRDLSIEPGKDTRELYERLLQAEPTANGPLSAGEQSIAPVRRLPPLVGREQDWPVLQQAWERAVPGQPYCLVISGEAGIGKTHLAEELLGWIRHLGFLTASARCFEAEGNMTYGPVAEWLRSAALRPYWKELERVWQIEIARVVPELQVEWPDLPQPGSLTEDWQRRRLFEGLLRAVSQVQPAPIALFIDDLQWCDRQTLSWMYYLLRSTLPVKLLLICTLRVEELSAQHPVEKWLADLRYTGRLTEVELGPLSAVETAELAGYVSGQVLDAASAAHLFAETEGHPLFVIESVRMAGETGQKNTGSYDGARRVASMPSATVQAVIAHRLAQLSPAARELAGVAAIIGRSFSYPVLARVSGGADEVSLVRSLDELWQRRIIREQGLNAYDFSHDKIREAAYNGLSAARRRLLHRQVGETLAALITEQGTPELRLDPGDMVRQVAGHFDHASLPERAVPYYHMAAEHARQMFANDEAVQCYQRALELMQNASELDAALAARIGEQCGDLLLLMTRREEARAAYDQVLSNLPPAERVWQACLISKIGNTWRDEYHFEESLPIYQRALHALGDPPAGDGQVVMEWWQCWIQVQIEIINVNYWLNWIEETDALIPQISHVIEHYGTLTQRADLFALLAGNEFRRSRYGPSDQALVFSRISVEANRLAGNLENNPHIRFRHGLAFFLNGALEEAEPEFSAVIQLAEYRGDLSLLSRCLTYLTILHRKRGNLGSVIDLACRALKTADAAQMPEYKGAARANLAWSAWRTGDLSRAREHSQAALSLWSQSPGVQAAAVPYYWTAIWPLIAIALAEDDLYHAVEYVRDLLQPHRKRLPNPLTTALSAVLVAREQGQDVRPLLISAIYLAEKLQEF